MNTFCCSFLKYVTRVGHQASLGDILSKNEGFVILLGQEEYNFIKGQDVGTQVKKEKKQIDYIYVCQRWGSWNRVTAMVEVIAGISVLKIAVTEKSKARRLSRCKQEIPEHLRRKLKKIVQQYHIEDCVVGADLFMAEKLQMADTQFLARKQELLKYSQRIIQEKELKITTISGGTSFLLVLDSESWSEQDVLQILLTAKDCYNDLNIVVKNNHINLSKLSVHLYEEWGIVLHILSEKMIRKMKMDFVLFLLEKWEDKVYRYATKRGYVVVENENGLIRGRQTGKLHAGFVYECNGIELPYQMAVDIFYQNPELYDKFAITFIDIYSL